MEHATAESNVIETPMVSSVLPDDRSQWPADAAEAFSRLLRELDRWCRRHDWPTTNNAWAAEHAVRQCW